MNLLSRFWDGFCPISNTVFCQFELLLIMFSQCVQGFIANGNGCFFKVIQCYNFRPEAKELIRAKVCAIISCRI